MIRTTHPFAKTAIVLAMTVGLCHFLIQPVAAAIPFSFGWNNSGRTGLGTDDGITIRAERLDESSLGNSNVIQVAAGGTHSLLLTDEGKVLSVGGNFSGQLGSGRFGSFSTIAAPIDTTNLGARRIIKVAAGSGQSLLLTEDGTVFYSGLDFAGNRTSFATPIDATNLTGKKITDFEAGDAHSLLLSDDGTVFSLGSNTRGRTGMGTEAGTTTIATAIDATNLAGRHVSEISASGNNSLLLADDGTVLAFGDNINGQTGLGITSGLTTVATPIDMTNLQGTKITQVATGISHSLLLAEDGTVFSFGSNQYGQTGLGTMSGNTLIATPILTTSLAGKRIVDIAAGDFHSLLLAADGTVFSFGWDNYGQLGRFSGSPHTAAPIDTINFAGMRVTSMSGGNTHSLILVVPEATSFALVGSLAISIGCCVRMRRWPKIV